MMALPNVLVLGRNPLSGECPSPRVHQSASHQTPSQCCIIIIHQVFLQATVYCVIVPDWASSGLVSVVLLLVLLQDAERTLFYVYVMLANCVFSVFVLNTYLVYVIYLANDLASLLGPGIRYRCVDFTSLCGQPSPPLHTMVQGGS